MKNILLLVHSDDGQEARLQVALDVTRALGGHLECLDVTAMPVMVPDYYGAGAEVVVLAELREQAEANRKRLEQRLAVEDIPWSIRTSFGTYVEAMTNASELADLMVVSSRRAQPDRRAQPERLPLRARRPILAVPPECKGLDVAGRALIAWDGSQPCNEAVRAAVPLLARAQEVAVLEVNQSEGAFAMTDVAAYLSRHGISAELVERNSDGSVAETILDHASHRASDYIVMGAYGKPRTAEAVFGGVTRTMLLESPIPLFVAH
ncbi:universal stress protein [Qipengyuania zhejiangensis]|uniref:universal stress protein n=1 Tax=Qipengyuania zhejiangensis TaxID=3077782 RepID=UPI002D78BA9E|nr:universal stress protein [Qipengyuania sp. Z2]